MRPTVTRSIRMADETRPTWPVAATLSSTARSGKTIPPQRRPLPGRARCERKAGYPLLTLSRRLLQPAQQANRLVPIGTAHLKIRAERTAHSRPPSPAEQPTKIVRCQMHTAHARRLAIRHAGYWRTDGRRDATRTATGTAIHGEASESDGAAIIIRRMGENQTAIASNARAD